MSLLHSFLLGTGGGDPVNNAGPAFAGSGLWWLFPVLLGCPALFNLTQVLRMPLMPPLPEEKKPR